MYIYGRSEKKQTSNKLTNEKQRLCISGTHSNLTGEYKIEEEEEKKN